MLKEINADVNGEKINIKFKSLNLHRLCKFAPEENITLQYTDEEKPVKFAQKDIVFIGLGIPKKWITNFLLDIR